MAIDLRLPLMALVIATGLLGVAPRVDAQNYPWCANYSMGFGGSRNCGFISFDQCMATVQGMGGFCGENNTYQPPPGPHGSVAPATRQARKHHVAKTHAAKNS
jgi:hypothetical protein